MFLMKQNFSDKANFSSDEFPFHWGVKAKN